MNTLEFKESMLMAFGTFRAHKLRSFLTILGVLIGVTAIIGMVSLIEGLNSAMAKQIQSLGSNVIYVSKYKPGIQTGRRKASERNRPPITYEDAQAIRRYCPAIAAVAPQNYYFKPGGNKAKFMSNEAEDFAFFGTLPDYEVVNNSFVEKGRFITGSDVDYKSYVCVIGYDVAKALFPDVNPVGKKITVNSNRFIVVGVMEKRQTVMGSNENNFILIPYGTFEKLYPQEKSLWLVCKAKGPDVMQAAIDQVTDLLRRRRGLKYRDENNFAVFGRGIFGGIFLWSFAGFAEKENGD